MGYPCPVNISVNLSDFYLKQTKYFLKTFVAIELQLPIPSTSTSHILVRGDHHQQSS